MRPWRSNCGSGLPQRLRDALAGRFEEQPERWPQGLQLDLVDQLRSASVSVPWYREALAKQEANTAAKDVNSRLDDMADIVCLYARDGEKEKAQRVALAVISLAFGVL